MENLSPNISIITLKLKGLNKPIKRYRFIEWITKHDLTICCLQETDFKYSSLNRLKVKRQKNIYHICTNQVKCQIKQISRKKVTRDNEGHTKMKKNGGTSRSESNPKCICTKQRSFKIHEVKLIELLAEVEKSTTIIGKFNSPLLTIDRIIRHKRCMNTRTPATNRT